MISQGETAHLRPLLLAEQQHPAHAYGSEQPKMSYDYSARRPVVSDFTAKLIETIESVADSHDVSLTGCKIAFRFESSSSSWKEDGVVALSKDSVTLTVHSPNRSTEKLRNALDKLLVSLGGESLEEL